MYGSVRNVELLFHLQYLRLWENVQVGERIPGVN